MEFCHIYDIKRESTNDHSQESLSEIDPEGFREESTNMNR